MRGSVTNSPPRRGGGFQRNDGVNRTMDPDGGLPPLVWHACLRIFTCRPPGRPSTRPRPRRAAKYAALFLDDSPPLAKIAKVGPWQSHVSFQLDWSEIRCL